MSALRSVSVMQGLIRPRASISRKSASAFVCASRSSLARACSNSVIQYSRTKIADGHAVNRPSVFYSKSMVYTHPRVTGIDLDAQTRCAHYRSALDIIAIKMKCCGVYYACKECHDALADHAIEVWPRHEWDQPVVLCGACGSELSIRQYLGCFDKCPVCSSL